MKIERNISLKQFNTFKVGGNADYFCKVSSVDDLKKAIGFSKKNKLQIFILGGGSNVLISDNGFKGLVIKIEIKGIEFQDDKMIVNAGEYWDHVVELSVQKRLYGIENMSFIPGTIGAGIVGNIGAYGSEIKDVVEFVEVLDINTLENITFNNIECEFDYRDSIFKKKDFIITKIFLKLSKNKKLNLSYKDIKEYFEDKVPNLTDVRNAILEIRKRKFPDLNKYGTAGSYFKNPMVDGSKIHLAKVLDDLGMSGLKNGNVELYKNQPLVVVNLGNANAYEIKDFTDDIAQKIFEEIKIKIIPEVVSIGEF